MVWSISSISHCSALQFQSKFDCDQAENCQALPCLAMRGAEGSEKFWESCCLPHSTVLQSVSLQQLSDVKFHHVDDFGRAPGQSFDQFRTYQDQAPNPARTGDSISLKLKSG